MTGRQADVLLAAYLASELVHRTVKPGEEVCETSGSHSPKSILCLHLYFFCFSRTTL